MKNYVCLIILMIAQISCAENDSVGRSKISPGTERMMARVSSLTEGKRFSERQRRENQFSELVDTFFDKPEYLGVSPFALSLYICLCMLD